MQIILQPYQIVAVFQINVSFIMYAITHSRLAKKAPSQNPPSNINLHNFSDHTFLTLVDIRITIARVVIQQGKNELHHVLYATQYKLHRFLPYVLV